MYKWQATHFLVLRNIIKMRAQRPCPALFCSPSLLWHRKTHGQDTVVCREPRLWPDDMGFRNGSPGAHGVLGQGWAWGWDIDCLYTKKLKYTLGGLPCFEAPPLASQNVVLETVP